jgi:hypothetical protein
VSTPRITSTLVSGLWVRRVIVTSFAQLLSMCRGHFPPDEQEERTDECAVRGHVVTGARAPIEVTFGSGPGRLLSDTKVSSRRVSCKAPLAHLEGESGRSEMSPTALLQGTHSLEVVEFSQVRVGLREVASWEQRVHTLGKGGEINC